MIFSFEHEDWGQQLSNDEIWKTTKSDSNVCSSSNDKILPKDDDADGRHNNVILVAADDDENKDNGEGVSGDVIRIRILIE